MASSSCALWFGYNPTEQIPGGILRGADFSAHTGSMKVLESYQIIWIADIVLFFYISYIFSSKCSSNFISFSAYSKLYVFKKIWMLLFQDFSLDVGICPEITVYTGCCVFPSERQLFSLWMENRLPIFRMLLEVHTFELALSSNNHNFRQLKLILIHVFLRFNLGRFTEGWAVSWGTVKAVRCRVLLLWWTALWMFMQTVRVTSPLSWLQAHIGCWFRPMDISKNSSRQVLVY